MPKMNPSLKKRDLYTGTTWGEAISRARGTNPTKEALKPYINP